MIGLGSIGGNGFIERPNRTRCRPRHMYGRGDVVAHASADMVPIALEGEGIEAVAMVAIGTCAPDDIMSGEGACDVTLTGDGDLAHIKWSVTGQGDMSDPGLIDGS